MAIPTAVQAHRGSPDPASGVRENTLGAFDRARKLDVVGVEPDVRLTVGGGPPTVLVPIGETSSPMGRGPPDLGRDPDWSTGSVFVNNAWS